MNTPKSNEAAPASVHRRTVASSLAWSVPAIVGASSAPAFALSLTPCPQPTMFNGTGTGWTITWSPTGYNSTATSEWHSDALGNYFQMQTESQDDFNTGTRLKGYERSPSLALSSACSYVFTFDVMAYWANKEVPLSIRIINAATNAVVTTFFTKASHTGATAVWNGPQNGGYGSGTTVNQWLTMGPYTWSPTTTGNYKIEFFFDIPATYNGDCDDWRIRPSWKCYC